MSPTQKRPTYDRVKSTERAMSREHEIHEKEAELKRIMAEITNNRFQRSKRTNEPPKPLEESPSPSKLLKDAPPRKDRSLILNKIMNMVVDKEES